MTCLEDIQLLMFLEDELSTQEKQEVKKHLDVCSECCRHLDEMKCDLEFRIKNLPRLNEYEKEVQVKGQEITWENIKAQSFGVKKEGNFMKMKKFMVAAVIMMAVFAAGSIPSVQVFASNLLQAFRVQQVDVVSISPADMSQIEAAIMQGDESFDLDKYGKIDIIGESESKPVTEEELADLSFTPILAADAGGYDTEYYLERIAAIEITPRVDNLNQLLKAMGSDYFLPGSMEGQTCRITIGDTLKVSNEDYQLMQCPAPVIEVPEGINVSEVADAMVGLPIWPEDLRRQLEAVSDWEHTLLIPANEGAQKVEVRGQDGVCLDEENSRVLIWEENGMLYFLASHSGNDIDLISIAESLR